jgi:hypothetical protein
MTRKRRSKREKKYIKRTRKHISKKNHRSRKFRRNMKGGFATFTSGSQNIGSIGLGNNTHATTSYTKGDTPTRPPSAISYMPGPIMDLKWTFDSGLKNFFNSVLGQPRQYSSSPTDQPIGQTKIPIMPTPITTDNLNSFKEQILKTYTNK